MMVVFHFFVLIIRTVVWRHTQTHILSHHHLHTLVDVTIADQSFFLTSQLEDEKATTWERQGSRRKRKRTDKERADKSEDARSTRKEQIKKKSSRERKVTKSCQVALRLCVKLCLKSFMYFFVYICLCICIRMSFMYLYTYQDLYVCESTSTLLSNSTSKSQFIAEVENGR